MLQIDSWIGARLENNLCAYGREVVTKTIFMSIAGHYKLSFFDPVQLIGNNILN